MLLDWTRSLGAFPLRSGVARDFEVGSRPAHPNPAYDMIVETGLPHAIEEVGPEDRMSLHRLAEERSLAFHRIVAERIRKDPRLLDGVRIRLDGWIARGGRSLPYAEEWRRLVDRPISELTDILTDPGQRARDLRQSTPFAGIVTPQERWRIWAEVREAFERKEEAHS